MANSEAGDNGPVSKVAESPRRPWHREPGERRVLGPGPGPGGGSDPWQAQPRSGRAMKTAERDTASCPASEVHKMNFRDKQATNYLNLV